MCTKLKRNQSRFWDHSLWRVVCRDSHIAFRGKETSVWLADDETDRLLLSVCLDWAISLIGFFDISGIIDSTIIYTIIFNLMKLFDLKESLACENDQYLLFFHNNR